MLCARPPPGKHGGSTMRNLNILQAGAHLRAGMIEHYQSLGVRRGDALARQYVYEIGQAAKLARGTAEASALLYAAADALSADLPIDSFRLPPVAVAEDPAGGGGRGLLAILRRQKAWIDLHYHAVMLGVWIGLALGGLAR